MRLTEHRERSRDRLLYLDANGAVDQVRVNYGDPATFGTRVDAGVRLRPPLLGVRAGSLVGDRATSRLRRWRYDHQRPYYSSATSAADDYVIWPVRRPAGCDPATADNVAPRVGVSWDMSGDSKSVVKAFYGRFYFNFADNLPALDPGASELQGLHVQRPERQRALRRTAGARSGRELASAARPTTVDPNLKNSYTDEFDLSYDRQLWGESAFRVAYVRKMEKNLYTTINTREKGSTPCRSRRPSAEQRSTGTTQGTQTITLFDIPSSLRAS